MFLRPKAQFSGVPLAQGFSNSLGLRHCPRMVFLDCVFRHLVQKVIVIMESLVIDISDSKVNLFVILLVIFLVILDGHFGQSFLSVIFGH